MSRAVTVAIPAHGDPAHVVALLGSLAPQAARGEPLRVVVADDASPVPLAGAVLRAATSLRGLEVQIVRTDTNGGPGAARNRALREVHTPWVAFMDSDEIAAPDWLERIEHVLADPGAVAAIVGRVIIGGEPSPLQHATEANADDGHHGSGNIILRADALRRLGGFDERFYDAGRRLHFREDADLRFRLAAAGLAVRYAPEVVVEHPPLGESFWGTVRLARRYYFDALLSREHPERFRAHMRERRVGPISLRTARHAAALVYGAGLVVSAGGAAARSRPVTRGGVALVTSGWALNVLALSWRKHARPRHLPAVATLAGIVPLVYLWHFFRGVVAFRHHPRL
jgi:GT2 family glycosyltransferase